MTFLRYELELASRLVDGVVTERRNDAPCRASEDRTKCQAQLDPTGAHVDEEKENALKLLQRIRSAGGIRGFMPTAYLGHGASAVVYKATHPTQPPCALKVFSPNLAERERIERQLALKGHGCAYLIDVYDGGDINIGDEKFEFLLMEFVEGEALSEVVKRGKTNDDPTIRKYLLHLCLANEILLSRSACHRDIKPANIQITPGGDLVLLDVGIIKQFDATPLTDIKGRRFIGSRRYASPESQHRTEDGTPVGWEALTVYQIGAVLYELILGVRLFPDVQDQPHADLVSAVDHEIPRVRRSDVGQDLLTVCRRSLAKKADHRPKLAELKAVAQAIYTPPAHSLSTIVKENQSRWEDEVVPAEQNAKQTERAFYEAMALASNIIADAFVACGVAGQKHDNPGTGSTFHEFAFQIAKDLPRGFTDPLRLLLQLKLLPGTLQTTLLGLGIFGYIQTPLDKSGEFFRHDPNLSNSTSVTIWDSAFEPAGFKDAVTSWVAAIVPLYLRHVRPKFDAHIVATKARHDAMAKGSFVRADQPVSVTIEEGVLYAFSERNMTRIRDPWPQIKRRAGR